MSLKELRKAEEMATDLHTFLEEIGKSFLSADAYNIATNLQEEIEEMKTE